MTGNFVLIGRIKRLSGGVIMKVVLIVVIAITAGYIGRTIYKHFKH